MTTSAPLASAFGVDLLCVDDLDPLGTLVSGNDLAVQRAKHLLFTPPGALLDSLDEYDSIDLNALLSRATTPAAAMAIPGQIVAALLSDPYFYEGTSATVSPSATVEGGIDISIALELADGPFEFVMPVANVPAAFFGGSS